MTLTRFVRGQLVVFAFLTVIALAYAATSYVGVQRLTGWRTYSVTAQFVDASGLYVGSVVTYRGVDIGTVSRIRTSHVGAEAVLQIRSGSDVPADTGAVVRSMSAIGEQFVDLQPRTAEAPYLSDGDVIDVDRTVVPTSAGTLLTAADELFDSLPLESVRTLLSETSTALSGRGDDVGRFVDTSQRLADRAYDSLDQTVSLVRDGETLLDVGLEVRGPIATAGRSLSEVTEQLRDSDAAIRSALNAAPAFSGTVATALDNLATPVGNVGADLQSLGTLTGVYSDNLRHLLTVYPEIAATFTHAHKDFEINNDPNQPHSPLDLKLGNTQMYPCTTGYESMQRRDPFDLSAAETPPGMWCKLPQDHPASVRGARNIPCAADPIVRTGDIAECPGGPPSKWPSLLSRPGN
ncbi:MCE family protein [Rhodococcus sp. NPDC060086]|uniref:MCE family protein n=1 Tax=Rhodococcus sp. NPDC060086 TaxID=3347055 RepID=UPI0036547931